MATVSPGTGAANPAELEPTPPEVKEYNRLKLWANLVSLGLVVALGHARLAGGHARPRPARTRADFAAVLQGHAAGRSRLAGTAATPRGRDRLDRGRRLPFAPERGDPQGERRLDRPGPHTPG